MKPLDLQINGYAGVDFCAAKLSGEDLDRAGEALVNDGVDGILATVITDDLDAMVDKLKNLVRLREASPLAKKLIKGFHIEGPFLNPAPGYIGAHPPEVAIPATPEAAKRLIDVTGGLLRVFTLAPERDKNAATIRCLVDAGVTVSAGHCNPDIDTLKRAIDAGLSMITHFGNGCPVDLPRHDNILQRILRLRDDLWIGFIPDGIHVPFFALRNYLDLVDIDRAFFVTDAISAAGMGPGKHTISGMTVEVDETGAARRPGSKNLAGSTLTMPQLIENLRQHLGFDDDTITRVVDINPRLACSLET